MCSSHNRACPSLSRPDSVAHLVNHPGLFSLFRLLWLSTLGLSLVRVFSHRDGGLLTGLAILWIVLRCGFSVFRCGRAFTLEHIPFHLGSSGLSLDLGFSSFFLGDITPGLSLSSREFAREGSAFACPFLCLRVRHPCGMFDTSCSCSRENTFTLRSWLLASSLTPSHLVVAMGRGSWLAQSADYEWTLTHVAELSSDINLSFRVG